jgi:hypothetical protein
MDGLMRGWFPILADAIVWFARARASRRRRKRYPSSYLNESLTLAR